MKRLTQLFLQGLLIIIPLFVTGGILYWLFVSAERLFRIPFQILLPENWYIPGLGLLAAIAVTISTGLLVKVYFIKVLFNWFEKLLNRLPLVKQLYGGVRDLMQFFTGGQREDLQKVVAVEFDGMRLIGFVTRESTSLGGKDELMSVYLPMSYQVGGYLVFLPASRCEVLDLSVHDAMQKVLTANISNSEQAGSEARPKEERAKIPE